MPPPPERRFENKLPTSAYFLFFVGGTLAQSLFELILHPERWQQEILFASIVILFLTAIWFFGIVPQFGNSTYIVHDTEIHMERAGRTIRIIPKADIKAIKDSPFGILIKVKSGPNASFLTRGRKTKFIQALYTPQEHTAHLPALAMDK